MDRIADCWAHKIHLLKTENPPSIEAYVRCRNIMKSHSHANSQSPFGQIQSNAVNVGEAAYLEMAAACRSFYALAPNTSDSQSSLSIDDLPPLLEDALRHQNTTFNDEQRAPDMPKVCVLLVL
jgi:hypothetical protein